MHGSGVDLSKQYTLRATALPTLHAEHDAHTFDKNVIHAYAIVTRLLEQVQMCASGSDHYTRRCCTVAEAPAN